MIIQLEHIPRSQAALIASLSADKEHLKEDLTEAMRLCEKLTTFELEDSETDKTYQKYKDHKEATTSRWGL